MEKVDNYTLTAIQLLLGCIGLAFFIMILAFFSEYNEFRIHRKAFEIVPFSQLTQMGFAPKPLLQSGIWKFYKEVYAAQVNNFIIVADRYGKVMQFTILTKEDISVQAVPIEHFRDSYVSSNKSGLVIIIPISSYTTPGIGVLQTLLNNLALTLATDGFHPAPDFTRYEQKLKREIIARAGRAAIPG